MEGKQKTSALNFGFIKSEGGLLLLWAYLILLAGGYNGLIGFNFQIANAVIGALVIGGWLVIRLVKKQRLALSGIEIGFLAFFLTQFISLALSQDVRRSAMVVLEYIVYFLVFYLSLDILRGGLRAIFIERTFLIVGAVVVGIGLYTYIQGYLVWQIVTDGLPYVAEYKHRLYAVFNNAPILAAFINLLIPFTIAKTLSSSDWRRRIGWGVYTLAALAVEYFTDTRGGLLGTAGVIGSLGVLWVVVVSDKAQKKALKFWKYLKANPLVLILLVIILLTPVIYVGVKAFQFEGDATHAPISSSRKYFWGAAFESFKEYPFSGSGPGTFPTTYIAYKSSPPDRPWGHAHNMLINFASETGTIGILGLIVFGIVLIQHARGTWQALDGEERVRWAAIVSLFIGHLAHTIADTFLYPFAIGMPLTVFLAVLVNLRKRPEQHKMNKSIHPLCLVVPALVIAAFGVFSLRAYADYNTGLALYESGDLVGAAAKFESAVQKDSKMALYWLANGYTYGELALEDDSYLLKAIERYYQGITLEPAYSLNYANLAALYWQLGDSESAINSMLFAVDFAPEEDSYFVNLGMYYETMGQLSQAEGAYWFALSLKPENAGSVFWEQTQFRQELIVEWREAYSSLPPLGTLAEALENGRKAITAGNIIQAEQIFILIQKKWPHKSMSYLGFAELALAKGDIELADRYLRVALSIQSLSYDDKVWPLLLWAEVAVLQGDEESAFIRYQFLYGLVTEYNIYGWGRKGLSDYAWEVYRREGLPLDVLPQFVRIDMTIELAERLLPLVDLYESHGDYEAARQVHAVLERALP